MAAAKGIGKHIGMLKEEWRKDSMAFYYYYNLLNFTENRGEIRETFFFFKIIQCYLFKLFT